MARVIPITDRILVKVIEEPEKMQGGIIVPQTMQKEAKKAKVIAVGPGRKELANSGYVLRMPYINVGETVLLPKFAGAPVIHNGEEHLIVVEGDILAIEEND